MVKGSGDPPVVSAGAVNGPGDLPVVFAGAVNGPGDSPVDFAGAVDGLGDPPVVSPAPSFLQHKVEQAFPLSSLAP